MKHAIIYARVSSREQEESGFSIPAQLDLLKKYCQDNGFTIEKVFKESISARETGQRPAYDEMIKFLRKNKKTAYNLVYEKNDRLLRNEYDCADIINLARTTPHFIHSVREMLVLHKTAHPTVFYMFTMFSANSSLYPRNLSLEVKKGMHKSAELGFYPSKLPVGYTRGDVVEKRKRAIVIDTKKAGYIVRAFELYSTQMFSYETLAKKLAAEGFIIKTRPCQKTNIEKILNNPFYMGEMEFVGKRYYTGNYTPLISKELFYTCQQIINYNSNPRTQTHEFLYSNMVKCTDCNCSLVGEIKKGKYVYYRCQGRKCKIGKVKYLKEATIDKLVETFLKSLTVPPENIEMILSKCKEVMNMQIKYDSQVTENITEQIEKIKKRLGNLYTDKLDGEITTEFYKEKREQYQGELDKLCLQLAHITCETDITMEKVSLVLELCKNAYSKYLSYDRQKRRYMLNLLVSNFTYDGQKLDINIKSTVKTMLESAYSSKWWASVDNVRTFLQEINKINIETLRKIQETLAA